MKCPFDSSLECKVCPVSVSLWIGPDDKREEVTKCSIAWIPTLLIEMRISVDKLLSLLTPLEKKEEDKK